jgi:preprotein translocase subunit SecG
LCHGRRGKMFTLLVILISLVALFLIGVVLLQSGKGGGLAAEFGGASSSTDSIMGGRQAANVLTRATWIGGGVFLFLALILAIMSARTSGPAESILRSEFQSPTTSPASVLESEGDAPPSMLQDAGETGAESQPAPVQPVEPEGEGGSN